jgi:ubiquinone/menaquinone biosynthesis C-methylase UbiE
MTTRKLPFDDESVKFFYSSHTLEHIPQKYCQHILNEMYRCLVKNGAVRLTMPDFDLVYSAYKNNDEYFYKLYKGENITQKFLQTFATHLKDKLDPEEVRKKFKRMSKEKFADYYTNKIPISSQKQKANNHINWWNFEKARKMLKKAGFRKIYKSREQKSKFMEMRGKSFFGNGFDMTHPSKSLFIEAIK